MPKKSSRFRIKIEAMKLAVGWMYRSSRFLTVSIMAIAIIGGLLAIVEPYVFKLLIDHLVGSGSETRLVLLFGFGSILAIYAVARILQNIFWDLMNAVRRAQAARIEKYATAKLMSSISKLDMQYFENPEYYNTLSRANDNLERIMDFFFGLTFFISELVSVMVIVGALLGHDFRIVIIVLLSAIPSVAVSMRYIRLHSRAYEKYSPIRRHARYYKSLITEHYESMKEIKLFSLRDFFVGRFNSLFSKVIRYRDRIAKSEIKWLVMASIVEGVLAILAALLITRSFLNGEITIGTLTFLWSLLFQFATHVRWVVRMLGDLNEHATYISPIVNVMSFEPIIRDSDRPKPFPKVLERGIEFRDVTFHYPRSKKPSLKNLNLTIRPGESIALVGENGSGKTTLIKLLCRLYDPTEGEILIDGVNIKEYSLDSLYENIGVIFQDFMKYEAIVEENIKYGRMRGKNSVHESAVKSGAWDFIKTLENKYKTHLGRKIKKKGVDLSVGQWQKMALARAFFKDSQILILDEPTAAVDAKAEYEIFRKFSHLTKDKTTILISHRFSTVRMADNIVVIDGGKIRELGTHEELLKKRGIYAKLFSLQAKGYK